MRRSAFIASVLGFVGISKAQQWRDGVCVKSEPLPGQEQAIREGKTYVSQYLERKQEPLNNQCPVCGTMAEPRKFLGGGMKFKQCDPPGKDPYIGCTVPTYHDPGPAITRCKRCNAAFWQEAMSE
jgi:hypothetical protein